MEFLPQTISAAAQSPLGILALLSVALSVLAYRFFGYESVRVKVCIFVLLFFGVVAFGCAMFLTSVPDISPKPTPQPSPAPVPLPGPAPTPSSQVQAYCGSLFHKSSDRETSNWKDSVTVSCAPNTQLIACEYWKNAQGNGPNDVASGPTPSGNGCKCECRHAAKEDSDAPIVDAIVSFITVDRVSHLGKGHMCGCYPVAVCASEPINLSGPKDELIKAAISSCK
ncbi:hypothetical protein [Methylomonas koyamae]|uniref:hypothetical protein n=1 Tax=Methylomonas koyamae TaxID=702114 RepID=UPI00112A97ED|nr:hypothetical protein [Methylomonas koyamae]